MDGHVAIKQTIYATIHLTFCLRGQRISLKVNRSIFFLFDRRILFQLFLFETRFRDGQKEGTLEAILLAVLTEWWI